MVETKAQVLVGLINVIAATLASLQTFLKFSERAEKHRVAASKYGALRRELEEILAVTEEISREMITPLRQRIDKLAEEAPHGPDKIWSKRRNVIEDDQTNQVGLVRQQ